MSQVKFEMLVGQEGQRSKGQLGRGVWVLGKRFWL